MLALPFPAGTDLAASDNPWYTEHKDVKKETGPTAYRRKPLWGTEGGENMRQGMRMGVLLLLILALACPAVAETCDHSWRDAAGQRERWLITENGHQQVREREMVCDLCGAVAYRQEELLEAYGKHNWMMTEQWHDTAAGMHMYMQVCADCGAVGAASIPCEGVPCRIAMEVQVQLADSPCEGASSHSWKMTDSYRQRELDRDETCWERKVVCALCGAAGYYQE